MEEKDKNESELVKTLTEEYEKKLTEQEERHKKEMTELEERLNKDKVETIKAIISGRDTSLINSGKVEEKKKKSWYQEELDKTRKNLKVKTKEEN